MSHESADHRDLWKDMGWGVSRGLALACLPVALTVLPGRLAMVAANPRNVTTTDASWAILGLGAGLGLVAGIFRPLGRSLVGSLLLGSALSFTALLGIRLTAPPRPDAPPFRPLGPGLFFGCLLGFALYLAELHRRHEAKRTAP